MTKNEIKIKNSLNLSCHTNTLYEIESTEDLLKVDYNKYDELLIIGCLLYTSPSPRDGW